MILKKAFLKLNNKKGFTLTETLSTLVIMSLVGIMVTAGIVTAVGVYKEVTEYANAQVLMTNTITLLNDTLIYADPITVEPHETSSISFEDTATKKLITISAENSGESKKGICISYGENNSDGKYKDKEPLINYVSNSDINVYTDWQIMPTSDGKAFIINLLVRGKSGDKEIARIDNYRIETINS